MVRKALQSFLQNLNKDDHEKMWTEETKSGRTTCNARIAYDKHPTVSL